jgi:uncharacterized DUF497 family protein
LSQDVEWDPAKAKANLRRHRIRFADAATVFDDPTVHTIANLDLKAKRATSRSVTT